MPFQNATGGAVSTQGGHVLSSALGDCGSPSASQVLTTAPSPASTGRRTMRTDAGRDRFRTERRAPTPCWSSPRPGPAPIRGGRSRSGSSGRSTTQGATSYAFYDFERGWPLVGLAVAFAVVIVAVARWRGLLALVGIVVAFLVLVVFLLPALRDGAPAVPVALVASAAILYAVIYLAHGVNLRTSAALLGTLSSLLLAAGLSWAAIQLAHLTGLSDEQNCHGQRVSGQRVDQRPAARRVHHRVAGRAQRRHRDAGVDGVRARPSRRQQPRGGPFSWARFGWAATTSPARCTRWCWPTPAVRCRCCCCSASPIDHWVTC